MFNCDNYNGLKSLINGKTRPFPFIQLPAGISCKLISTLVIASASNPMSIDLVYFKPGINSNSIAIAASLFDTFENIQSSHQNVSH